MLVRIKVSVRVSAGQNPISTDIQKIVKKMDDQKYFVHFIYSKPPFFAEREFPLLS